MKNRTSATPCQNVQVWNLYGIWKICSIPYLSHSVFHTDVFLPFHTIVCPDYRRIKNLVVSREAIHSEILVMIEHSNRFITALQIAVMYSRIVATSEIKFKN